MTYIPYDHPNINILYGEWTGSGYSAGVQSPSFVPLTDAQENVDGSDAFDDVSALHDIAENNAQQALLTAFNANPTQDQATQALVTYYQALAQGDQNFITQASNVTATTIWGQAVQQAGIAVMQVKMDAENAIIARLQDPNDPLASQLTAQASGANWSEIAADCKHISPQCKATM